MSTEKYDITLKAAVEALGGKDNILSIAHCATRLRVIVQDNELVNETALDDLPDCKGFFYNSGQYQLIFGTGYVNRVFEAATRAGLHTGDMSAHKEALAAEASKHPLQTLVRMFADVFVPIIPVLVATGLFMGLRGLILRPEILSLFGLSPEHIPQNLITWTQILTDTTFIFLPAFVAWSATRAFGGTPILGLALGLMLVSPSLPNAWGVSTGAAEPLMFFGFIPVVGYQASIIPAFISAYLLAKVEKWLRNYVTPALELVVTPFVTLLVAMSVALFVIGPIFHYIEILLMKAVYFFLGLPLGLGGLIYGFISQIVVVTGVHHILNLVEINLLANTQWDPINAIITGGIAAQGAAALAVSLKSSNKKLRALGISSAISAFFGITEPSIFGVNLRYGGAKPYVCALVGGGLSGWFASLMGLKATGMAITVIPGTLLYLNGQLPWYIVLNFIGMATAFGLTWVLWL